jgi:hypothetical protein
MEEASKPGMVSAIAGISGCEGIRVKVETPSTLSLPLE